MVIGNSGGGEGGWGVPKAKIFKRKNERNWNFRRGQGVQSKKPSMGEVISYLISYMLSQIIVIYTVLLFPSRPQTCLAAILRALGTGFCSACAGCSKSLELPDSFGDKERLSLLLEKLRCFIIGVRLLREIRWSFLSSVSSAFAFGASSST